MNMLEGEWGLSATIIALILILAIFGTAYRFIQKASRTNRRVRRHEVQEQENRHERSDHEPGSSR